jgi:hypothetical protein
VTRGVVSLGYTEREATFLGLTALLSGYFLRRHFNEFIGKECGALGQRFIERALARGHVKATQALGGRVYYQIVASRIYAELGDASNRNRREHRPDAIRRRLMALDFALLGPGANWLLSESQKQSFFSKLDPAFSEDSSEQLKRAFVDKQPICRREDGSVEFCFVDEGLKTLSQWVLFLKAHRSFCRRLDKAEVIFATCDLDRVAAAERLFRSTISGEAKTGGVDVERLQTYFSTRKLFEEKRYDVFTQSRLNELRENRRVFSGPSFEALYETWCRTGNCDLPEVRSSRVSFSSMLLPHHYEWLSPFRNYERRP